MRFARIALALLVPPALFVQGVGCSDPVPAIPRGAYVVSLSDFPAIDCEIVGHNGEVGDVADSTKNKLYNDAEEGAQVSCEVSGEGNFRVTGSIFLNGNYLEIVVPGIAAGTGTAAPAIGSVAYASLETGGQAYSSDQCQFWFANEQQGVAAGKFWAGFKCDTVVSEMSTCKISQGYVIFENCGTGVEED
jgi:hypothetical protein